MKKSKNLPSEATPPNHLNSIWLEGTVVDEPQWLGEPAAAWSFTLAGGPSVFTVDAGPRTVTACGGPPAPGRRVRVIGRLFQRRSPHPDRGGVAIWGELVEPVTEAVRPF